MDEKELSKETKTARQELIADGADEGAVDAYIELDTGDNDLSQFGEAYQGQYKNNIEFAQEQAEQMGSIDFKERPWPQYCIDWEYAARDLMMDYSEENGYYFRNL